MDSCCPGRRHSGCAAAREGSQSKPEVVEVLDGDDRSEGQGRPATHTDPASLATRKSVNLVQCIGHTFHAPDGISPHAAYPFALHDKLNLPWDYTVRNRHMVLHSRTCNGTVETANTACLPCRTLARNNILSGIMERMRSGIREGTGWAYYGMGGIHELLRLKSCQIEHYRLPHLNHARKLARKVAALDDHKQFLKAVASQKVERVDRIIRLGLKQGRRIKGLLEQYLKAARGLYKPKSFEEEDYLRGLVLWKLGGNRIASIAHRALGLPSITTLRNQVRIPLIALSVRQPTTAEVSTNVEMSFGGMEEALRLPHGARRHHAVMMFDEIAMEKRLRWDPKTNMLVGVCQQHVEKVPLEFVTEENMKEVFMGLDDGRVHYAGEVQTRVTISSITSLTRSIQATIGALGLLTDDNRLYAARSILVSRDCKKETGPQHAKLLQTSIDGVDSQKANTNIRIVSLTSDGESRRGVALAKLTFKGKLAEGSDIYGQLSGLPFLDLHVGDDNITADKDYKHVFKRLRNLLMREKGVVANGTRVTPSIIKAHLQAENISADHIRAITNPDDKQDVKLAFNKLKAVWSLPRTTTNTNPGFVKARHALWVYGQFLRHLVYPCICVDLTLSQQLEHLSAAAHLAMYLHRTDGDDCIPTNLYIDIMIMIKNVFFCAAKAKVDNPKGSFWIILLGTDRLEELFGNLRTMIGNDANLDLLQVSWRLSGTAEVANILSKFPHWDRPPCRLQLPALAFDGTPLPTSTDHLKPRFWKGDQKLKPVTLQMSWAIGRRVIEADIAGSSTEFQKLEQLADANPHKNFTILAPNGKLLVDPQSDVPPATDEEECDMPEDEDEPARDELADDNTDARMEIEDALGKEVEEDGDSAITAVPAFDRTITIRGAPVLKSRALATYSKHQTFPTLTDRLKRVQHLERYTTRTTASTHLEDPDSPSASCVVHDPIATIVWSDNRPWLGIGEVVGIRVDGKAVDEVAHDMLVEDSVQLSFQLLGVKPSTVDNDPSQTCDWRSYSVKDHTFTIPGRLAEPLNPTVASQLSDPSKVFYLLESSVLVALAAGLLAKLLISDLKEAPKIAPLSYFPYREPGGM